jgi:membrane protease YdiL (CAAX protease family)
VNAEKHEFSENHRALAAWEIASACVSFLLAAWFVAPMSGGAGWLRVLPLGLAVALMLFSHRARGETLRDIGWRTDNFGAAARLLVGPTIGFAVVFVLLGWRLDTLRPARENFASWALWLPVWALLQQYVLQGYINRRAQIIWGAGGRSILLTALVFALLHAPNPGLSALTFAGGLLWSWAYQRAPNLFALAFSHALLALALARALGPGLKNLRVGLNYLG